MFSAEIKCKIEEDISILVRLDNHPWNYLCECGDAASISVKEFQNTNAIFISHTHIDHFVNFDAVIRHQIGIQRRVVICGPKGIATQVQAKIKSYTWNLIKKGAIVYEIRELVSDNEIHVYELEPPIWELIKIETCFNNIVFQEKDFSVSAVLLDHKTPSMAYKFIEKNSLKINLSNSAFRGGRWVKELKEAFSTNSKETEIVIEEQGYKAEDLFHLLHVQEGDSLGIIMDHAANKENHSKILQHFSHLRRVYIESFYKEEDKEQANTNYHSYSSMSGKIMKEAKVKEAVPVHFSRKYKKDEIDELVKEFEAALK